MKPIVDDLVKRIYGEPIAIAEEVPVSYGRTDILYLYENDPYSIAVELKIKDWRRGLQQAFRNLFYAKYSFLAIQWKRTRLIDLSVFAKYGIGLIAVNGNARIVLEPRESKMFFRYRQSIIKYLREQIAHRMVYTNKST